MHGYGIAQHLSAVVRRRAAGRRELACIRRCSGLLLNGWVKAEWGASENNRRARFYTLTPAGRKQLAAERHEFDRLILAIHKVLNAP